MCSRCGEKSGPRYRCAKCRGLDAAWREGRKGEMSPQQRRVLMLKRGGMSNEAIAARLRIQVISVDAAYKLAKRTESRVLSEAEIDELQRLHRIANMVAR